MVKASKGSFNRKTRRLKGKSVASVAQLVRTFKVGDKVIIDPKAIFIGMPHLRYASRHGVITEKRGKSYMVEVGDFNKKKSVICGPVHLKLAS
ncbi:MAG: 50S ribosomal protein L21e [Candidatus Micrarchaeia archaeon]